MIDHLFSAVLTFCLLAAGTAAVGSLLLSPEPVKHSHAHVIQLPPVVITAQRLAAPTAVAKGDSTEPAASRVQ